MLKKIAYKRIIIVSLSLLILLIVYLFPERDGINITSTVTYTNPQTMPIYLLDNNNYVSRIEVIKKNNDPLLLVDDIINNLIINDNNYTPTNFKRIIPKNTKILSKKIDDNILKIDFSKELLNVSIDNEEKMIEAIIYSLTEIKGIDKIMIFVEGNNLLKLPNSKKELPLLLDRSYGINKVYEIESIKDTIKITTYYVNKIDNNTYYIPITSISNNNEEKVEIIIEKLKSYPIYQTNLVTYLTASSELLKYELLENSISLTFNNEILSLDENKIIEEVKYSIALSLRDTYNINETIFFVDDMLMDAVVL